MLRSPRRPVHLTVLAAALLAVGCGPFGYLKKVAKESNKAVADAKAVGAEQYAPYEYWGAVSYLEQAKVMMAYSEYERSFDYGERAKDLAEEAKKKTQMREAGKTEVSDPSIARPEDELAPEEKGDGKAEGKSGAKVGGEVEVGGKAGGK